MAAKRKTGRAKAKPSAPKIEAGANRRAMAVLTHKLSGDIAAIDEKIGLLNKQKANRYDQYKKDTGRSKSAARRAMAFFRMEDSVARMTEINDQAEIMQDLGLMDASLFQNAGAEASLAVDKVQDQMTPGYIESLGRRAFREKRNFDSHSYPSDARAEIEKWERGFLDEARIKEEETNAPKGAAPQPAAE